MCCKLAKAGESLVSYSEDTLSWLSFVACNSEIEVRAQYFKLVPSPIEMFTSALLDALPSFQFTYWIVAMAWSRTRRTKLWSNKANVKPS